jgi:hypothetical protein
MEEGKSIVFHFLLSGNRASHVPIMGNTLEIREAKGMEFLPSLS